MKSTKRGKLQEKTPKITQSWSNQFWIPIENGSVTLQLGRPSIENLKYRWKKTHSNNWGNHFQQNEVKKKLQPVPFIYVWRKFEHQVKDMCSSQKVQVFSSLRRPEAQFRLAQGHHQAGAITGSINNIQNTSITVYEVESHKTVNTKFWERTNWFSELIQEIFHHNFQQSYTRRHKKIESKIECNAKAYQPILQNTTAEKYKHVQRTDQNISRTIEKIWCRQKGIKNEQFMEFLVHADMKLT